MDLRKFNEYIFLRTLEDIRSRIDGHTHDPYNLVRACGLVRHLILDKNSLVNEVRKYHKIKIFYRVNSKYNVPFSAPYSSRTLHSTGDSYTTIKQEVFLKLTPLRNSNIDFTVKEIIQHASHVLGGVHTGEPKDEKDTVLLNSVGPLGLAYYSKLLIINSICLVVLDSLAPLEKILKAST